MSKAHPNTPMEVGVWDFFLSSSSHASGDRTICGPLSSDGRMTSPWSLCIASIMSATALVFLATPLPVSTFVAVFLRSLLMSVAACLAVGSPPACVFAGAPCLGFRDFLATSVSLPISITSFTRCLHLGCSMVTSPVAGTRFDAVTSTCPGRATRLT